MAEEQMRLSEKGRRKLNDYLDAIDAALSKIGIERAERRGITDDVEGQIMEMLEMRAGNEPSVEDVEKVLEALDPPEAYAARTSPGDTAPMPAVAAPAPGEARLSRTAVVGAAWAPFFLVAFVLYFMVHFVESGPATGPPPEPTGPNWIVVALAIVAGVVGFSAPFGTTICGLVSIAQIRNSAGRLYGLALAAFDALLFPLLILDFAILAFWAAVGRSFEWRTAIDLILTVLTAAIVDILIVRAVWLALNPSTATDTPDQQRNRKTLATVGLGCCVGGLIVALAVAVIGALLNANVTMLAYFLFIGFQVIALILGLLSLRHPFGMAASIASAVLMAGSVVFLA